MAKQKNADLVQVLAAIGDLGQGSLASIILRKKGSSRAGKIYGDDLTHVLLWTGFHYKTLVKQSQVKLESIWAKGTFLTNTLQAVHATGHPEATLADISAAAQELQGNFHRVLNGKDPLAGADIESICIPEVERSYDIATVVTEPVFEPLVVGGKTIIGAKIYVGKGSSKDPRAAQPGTIYIDGVKIGELILEPGVNGIWAPTQSPRAIAKDIIRKQLPIGLYVRYSLARENLQDCKIGSEASIHAKEHKVPIDPEAVQLLLSQYKS